MDMKTSPTLLILTQDSPDSYSPAGERVRHMALAGRHAFGKTLVLALQGKVGEHRKPNTESAVSLYSVNFARAAPFPISNFFDPVKFLMLFAHGLKLSRRHKPFYILVSMPPLETGLSAWLLARILRMKLVIDLRDDWESAASSNLKRYFARRLLNLLFMMARQIYSSSVSIFAATQTIAETARKRGISTVIHVVPNGADSSVFFHRSSVARNKIRLKYALPLEKTVILYSGSGINPYNRLDIVLSSLTTLPEEIISRIFLVFYVYGGLERLERQKRALGLPDSLVEVRNPLPRTDLAEVMAGCDIGLVPFDDKPYLLCARSTKLYEYLSAGLYVISSGPEGGELDRFFSLNSRFGLFTSPSVGGFKDAFQHVLRGNADLFRDGMRDLRHSFIKENYDRQKVMRKAIETLFCNDSS